MGFIRSFVGTEDELAHALATYPYTPNDVDHASWGDVAMGPHRNSVDALQTVPASILPRDVLREAYRLMGASD